MGNVTVLLATEGTYPFHLGGVSTWCDALVNGARDTDFIIYAVAMNPYVESQFTLPGNVKRLITVPLWGTQDPSEHRDDAKFSDLFLKKQRTTPAVIHEQFLPLLAGLLQEGFGHGQDAERLGQVLASLYRYFQLYDYKLTWKDDGVWNLFRDWAVATGRSGQWPDPNVFETVQALGWLYHFLIILNTEIPPVDVVHSSAAAFCGMVGVVSRVLFGTPYLLTEHGVYVREQYLSVGRSNMTRFSKRFLLAMVSAVVRANLHYADQLSPVCAFNTRWERLLGASPPKIRVIYNGVSPRRFFPAPRKVARDTSGPLEILSIARSDPNKDLESLLRATALVKEQVPHIHVTVQGSVSVPDYHVEMVALRKTLGLEDVVEFKGHSEDVAETYRQADIMVQSSVSEAFPYSVIEAMMSGLPIVATDVGGTREALADTGIVVPARNPARLALGLIILAQDQALRQTLGQAAHRRAERFFTIDRATREFADAYQRLAGVSRPAGRDAARRVVLLDKAYALLRIGLLEPGLEKLEAALSEDPSGAAAPALLVQIANVERELGRRESSQRRLVVAWLLAQARQTDQDVVTADVG